MSRIEEQAEKLLMIVKEMHDLANEINDPDKAIYCHKMTNKIEDAVFELNCIDRSKKYGVKRFVVFAYDYYYPSGGIEDMIGDFDTREEAEEIARELYRSYDVVEILDLKMHKEVYIGDSYNG